MLEVQFSHDESGWSNVIVIVVILEAIWLIKCYQYCYCIRSNLACQMLLLLEAILLIKCYCYWKQSGWSNVYRWRWFWTQWAGISQTRLCYTSLTLSTRATESHRSSATQCTNFYQTTLRSRTLLQWQRCLSGGTQEVIVNRGACQFVKTETARKLIARRKSDNEMF